MNAHERSPLSSNGGNSVKDIVTRAARDAAKAAEDSRKALDLAVSLDKRTKRNGKRLSTTVREVGELKAQTLEIEKRMARYVIHEANNTLHHSRLVEEEKELLDKLDREGRDAQQGHGI
jgi:hypothetical protein